MKREKLRRLEAANRSETFREFVVRAAPKYRWYRHCEVLAAVLQRVADGEIKRLMVFMPPRHGKSEEISRLFSAYFLSRYPHRWVAISSYAAELAFTLSRAARENYVNAGCEMKVGSGSLAHWETGSGGGLFAAGVGGPFTGKGFHLGIIDDPLKNAADANSETIRESQKEWYRSTFYTREEPWSETDPNAAIILIQTRWNEDDLAGWQLAEEAAAAEDDEEPERWHIVNLPAIAEDPHEFPKTCTVEPDWRKVGEPLCPERRPLEKLKRILKRIGGYFFDALFQQRPSAKEGSFFKVANFKIVKAAPAGLRKCRAWDQASTEGGGDWTVGALVSGPDDDGQWYVEDVTRGQWDTAQRNRQIRQTAALDGRNVRIRGAQDPGNTGVDAAKAFVKMLAGFTVVTERASGSKEVRADPYSAQVNAVNVNLVEGAWNKAFIEEHRQFPTGKHDDQVDATADGFNELAGQFQLETDAKAHEQFWDRGDPDEDE